MISPEKVGLSAERLARIKRGIEKHIGEDKIAGAITLLARRGELVHLECMGLMDRENKKPMREDTIIRIWSMTKPIVSVALMMLYERGCFQLFDPVSKYIPAFADLKVYAGEGRSGIKLVDLEREVTVRDLLIHTSGLTYHWWEYGSVEQMYRDEKVFSNKPLHEFIADLMKLPLAFQPGTQWRYSVSVDVVGYLIELLSGQTLDEFLLNNMFKPLGMVDTGFYVPREKLDRFSAEYGSCYLGLPGMTKSKWFGDAENGVNELLNSPTDSLESSPHKVLRGGHGLVSTVTDYLRFCQMLLNKGELNGKRHLSRKTVELITANHIASELMPLDLGGDELYGYGFGLGFRVMTDVGIGQTMSSKGEFGWAGAACTYFWIDPVEEFIGIQMAQFQPGSHHLIADDFRVTAYQAIVD
jgi:CubicO group peptidase (beta-lactamase class C family)